MRKYILLIALALAFVSTATALDPIKVAIYKPGAAVSVQININDYSSGTANPKFTGIPETLTPNGSGIIIVEIAGAGLTAIPAGDVNSHYVVDVIVESALYAQYRLDKLIIDQAIGGTFDIDGNITPSENGAGSIGTDEKRWGELFVEGNTVHIGPALGMAGNELAFSYDDGTNTATMTVAGKTALTSVEDAVTIPQQATIDGLAIGQGGGDIATNTAVGANALTNNTSGSSNTATGYFALLNNTSGSSNTATGNSALLNNTSGSSNTATGNSALSNNTSGSSNTATGNSALLNNTSGSNNTATGNSALWNNTSGSSNTATGNSALLNNTSGSSNTATGNFALLNNTSGSSNTATGNSALLNNTSGSSNTATGKSALLNNTSGSNNTATGNSALSNNTSGSNNTAIGNTALWNNTSGSNNTATGNSALIHNTEGNENSSFGDFSMDKNIAGNYNTAVGSSSLRNNTTSNNTAVGRYSLVGNTSGQNNSAIGLSSGQSLSTGSNNVFVGKDAGNNGLQKADAENSIAIGYGAFTTASNQVVIGNSSITETQLRGATLMDLTGVGTRNIGVDANGKIVESAGGAFTSAGGTTRANTTSDNFYVGQGDYTYVGPGQEYKMFYDRSNGSFRVGNVDGTQWDSRGSSSFAAGYKPTATGSSSVAIGDGTTASGDYSTAMGFGTTASGNGSTAMGSGTTASGNISTAMGLNTTASGTSIPSTAMGNETTASGDCSTAMGFKTIASGTSSTSMGYETEAQNHASTAIGRNSIADEDFSTAMGKYNDNTVTGELLTIGNGTGTSARSNAFEVFSSGNIRNTGFVQNKVTTTTDNTELAAATTSVINHTGTAAIATANLPATTDGSMIYLLNASGGNLTVLGNTIADDDVVTLIRIGGTWYATN